MAEGSIHDVPPSVLAFAERLSPRVRATLGQWEWTWHPERRFPREELQRRLAEKGIPEWPFLWPLEEAFAGVEVRIAWEDLDFGIARELPRFERKHLLDEDGQIRFVPVGSWDIYAILLDAAGRMYLFDAPDQLTAVEPSFESFLEDKAMATEIWSPISFSAHLAPKTAVAAFARERGIPPVVEASNELHRWWQDEALTLFEPGEGDLPAAIWAKTLAGLVEAIDTAGQLESALELRPQPSYEEEDIEVLGKEELRARAPTVESLRARAGARRFPLLGTPSIYEGDPPSTGDVWLSGQGETLQIDALERRQGELYNYWQLTPGGSHALLSSRYGKG